MRSKRARKAPVIIRVLTFAALALAFHAVPASAQSWTVTGNAGETGDPVSGTAAFSVSGNTLTVVLTNTMLSPSQGDALTGIVWGYAGAPPTLALMSTALTSGSDVFASKTSSNTTDALNGSWTDDFTGPAGEFGVATTGVNLFNGNSITLGNASPNYGIVGPGTFPGGSFGGAKFPFIQDSLTFNFMGATGLSASSLDNVEFIFGTSVGDEIAGTTTTVAPEGSSLSLLAFGFLPIFGGYALSRIRRLRTA